MEDIVFMLLQLLLFFVVSFVLYKYLGKIHEKLRPSQSRQFDRGQPSPACCACQIEGKWQNIISLQYIALHCDTDTKAHGVKLLSSIEQHENGP